VDKDNPEVPVRLLDFADGARWVFQSGLRASGGGDEPNHLADFSAPSTSYELAESSGVLRITLDWQHPGQLRAQKVYTFRRGQYAVDLDLVLENQGATPWRGAAYAQLLRRHVPVDRSFTNVDSYSFTGPVLYDGDRYEKLDVEDLAEEPLEQSLAGGWLASIQHHFLAAIVPPGEEEIHYQALVRGEDYVVRAVTNVREIPPGGRVEVPLKLFIGPKLQEQLAATADGLELTVDYGMLTILAQPLFWIMSKIHSVVGNWGWSIIIITILIKLAFYKLTETSGRSMAKMRKLQPRLKALQEQYKDNREELSRHMMELYKREKVNPAAGCLPILIQMPFFFAFYWVLIESVEIRQAPFMLWITDISSRDPYFVLPLLMGAAMFFQTRLNPAPPDPVQARVMQIMPLVFTVFFAFFPAGLVLYWLTNTGLSILQQWRINTVIGEAR
jgi:YidC/Oxa1 family membrane protein insertase